MEHCQLSLHTTWAKLVMTSSSTKQVGGTFLSLEQVPMYRLDFDATNRGKSVGGCEKFGKRQPQQKKSIRRLVSAKTVSTRTSSQLIGSIQARAF